MCCRPPLSLTASASKQVFIYNMMGWPLPVEPKKDEGSEEERESATNKIVDGNEGSDLRRRKTSGGVTKIETVEQWKALLKVCASVFTSDSSVVIVCGIRVERGIQNCRGPPAKV